MMSTASKGAAEDYVVRSEEDGEDRAAAAAEEELELGLSLGARKVTGGGGSSKVGGQWGEYRRILTAEDFPSLVSRASPRSSSSSSVSSSSPAVAGAGLKRAADSVSPPSQAVVGWPPIRTFRMNSLVNQSRENVDATANKKTTNTSNSSSNTKEAIGSKDQEKRQGVPVGTSLFVKVNMDGDPIGRKVDLSAHLSYESLAAALEIMFHKPTTALATSFNGTQASKLLDGSSEFALTYEDKDGDWMLVGDVPWGMFLSTVKRLRIMRTSDASGLAPRLESCRGNGAIRS